MQRYTPRRKIGENYSQPNMERLSWVDKKKLIHPEASFRGWVLDEACVFSQENLVILFVVVIHTRNSLGVRAILWEMMCSNWDLGETKDYPCIEGAWAEMDGKI